MKQLKECNVYEALQPDGNWTRVHLEQLEEGDLIRIFDTAGRPVNMHKGSDEQTIIRFSGLTMTMQVLGDAAAVAAMTPEDEDLTDDSEAIETELQAEAELDPADQDVEYVEQAIQFLHRISDQSLSVQDQRRLVATELDKRKIIPEVADHVWKLVAEAHAEALAVISGQISEEEWEKEYAEAEQRLTAEFDGHGDDTESSGQDECLPMEDLFVPTTEHDRELSRLFLTGATNRQAVKHMKELGLTCDKYMIEDKREGWRSWMRSLDS